MKQLTDTQLINLLSISLGITVALFGVMVYYFRNELHRQIEHSNLLNKGWEDCAKNWNITIEEMVSRGNKILELINSNNILKLQNKKYSSICRRLYDENKNLKMDVQGLESLFVDMKNKTNEFELKIAELEKGKLKKRDRKL
jgi:hypothetical protein